MVASDAELFGLGTRLINRLNELEEVFTNLVYQINTEFNAILPVIEVERKGRPFYLKLFWVYGSFSTCYGERTDQIHDCGTYKYVLLSRENVGDLEKNIYSDKCPETLVLNFSPV